VHEILIGVDEAGLGPWAGPLTVGLVVLQDNVIIPGVGDSKKIREETREELVDGIHQTALYYKVLAAAPDYIDNEGVYTAWDKMVEFAILEARKVFPDARVIVDGNRIISTVPNYCPVVKADDKYQCVGAASILAKYLQCGWMDDYHVEYPQYGFNKHRGYGTAQHKKALEKYGPCPAHRKSYKPIKALLARS
jgi:ribonuclease HII